MSEWLIAGLMISSFIAGLYLPHVFNLKPKTVGTLRSKQDEDGTYLFLELNDDNSMNKIANSKYVTLEVDISRD